MDRKEYNRKYYEKNGERLRANARQWRLENPEKYKALVEREQGKYYSLKDKVFTKLGDKCPHCGFKDRRALQIDHVNGCGYEERKVCKSAAYLRRVLADTKGKYQILCANCNWIKKAESPLESPSIYTPKLREKLLV